jgi:uncharacterized protein (TIRG00374 family)
MIQFKLKVKGKKLKIFLNLATLIILGVLIYSSRKSLGGVIENIKDANAWLLLLFLPLQAVNYHSYSRMYQENLSLLDERVGYWDMLKVAMELNFVNYVFPSAGISGFGYFTLRMRTFGVRASRSAMAQTLRWLTVFGSFVPVLMLGLVLLALTNRASNLIILIASGISFGIVLLFAIIFFLLERKNGLERFTLLAMSKVEILMNFFRSKESKKVIVTQARVARIEESFKRIEEDYKVIRRDWRRFIYASRWGVLANITEIVTIGVCFMAYGFSPVWGAIIVSYGVASLSGLIAILPGGVGIYEALMTGILVSSGVPASISLTATLTYRLINTFLAIPPGLYFYSRAINEARAMSVELKKEERLENLDRKSKLNRKGSKKVNTKKADAKKK